MNGQTDLSEQTDREWIRKKDLLLETGISYGQLYRWKRERLIPDAWFVKRASYTGQETFFPRGLVLERVRFILSRKDEYSLNELKDLLSPDSVSRSYPLCSVADLEGAKRSAALYKNMYGSDRLNHGQALSIIIAADYDARCRPEENRLRQFLAALNRWQDEREALTGEVGRICVLRLPGSSVPLFLGTDTEILLCEDACVEYALPISEISRTFTQQLNRLCEVNHHE